MLFYQDLALHRELFALHRNEQIYVFPRPIDTERRLPQMKIQGKISLQCHTQVPDLCDLMICQRHEHSELPVLSVMRHCTFFRSVYNSLRRSDNGHHHIHDQRYQEKQCQIPQQVFPDIPKYSFAQYPLHLTNPPVLPPAPVSRSGNFY